MTCMACRKWSDLAEKLQLEIARFRLLEKSLRESEELYRTLLQKSLAGIYVVQNGKFRDVNENAASFAGYAREDLIGMKSDAIIHPDDRTLVKINARLMLQGKRTDPHSFRIITKQHHVRWVMEMVTSITYNGRPAILGNSMDVTELMATEERLRESESLYRAIFEHTGTATIIIEEDTTVSLVNGQFVTMSGYRRKDWEGKRSWTEFVVPEDVERMLSYHRLRRINPHLSPRNYEFGFIDSRGRRRDIALTVGMIPGTKKSVASMADITDLKGAERLLRESEILYRTIFETTGTAVIIIEEDMTISLANTEFETLTGAPKEYWEGKRQWTEIVADKDLERMKKYHEARRLDPSAAPGRYEFTLVDKNGQSHYIFITIAMIPGTKKSVASLTDITEQKRTEAALRKREGEIQRKSRHLQEINTALKVLLQQREEDRRELEEKVLMNVKTFVLPYLEKLRSKKLTEGALSLIEVLEANLSNIISPFSQRLTSRYLHLTPKELQVADLIKNGKTTKDIAEMMGICPGAVSLHRHNIRKKLGLNKEKINLRTFLSSME